MSGKRGACLQKERRENERGKTVVVVKGGKGQRESIFPLKTKCWSVCPAVTVVNTIVDVGGAKQGSC